MLSPGTCTLAAMSAIVPTVIISRTSPNTKSGPKYKILSLQQKRSYIAWNKGNPYFWARIPREGEAIPWSFLPHDEVQKWTNVVTSSKERLNTEAQCVPKMRGCQLKTKLFLANFLCCIAFSQKLTHKKALKPKSISSSSPDRFSLRFRSMLKIKPVLQGLAKQLVWHQYWVVAFIKAL